MKKVLFILFLIILLFLTNFISAQNISLSLTPKLPNGNYPPLTSWDYQFDFTTDSSCTNVVLSHTETVRTDVSGRAVINIDTSGMTGIPKYLCETRDGSLRKTHELSVGLFWNLYAQSLNLTGNITASYFIGDGSQLTGLTLTETDPYWSANFTASENAWLNTTNLSYYLASNPFSFYNSTVFDINDYLLTANWNATNTSYYLATNPFSFVNITTASDLNNLITLSQANITDEDWIEDSQEGGLNVNQSDWWITYDTASDLNNLITIDALNITLGTLDWARIPTLYEANISDLQSYLTEETLWTANYSEFLTHITWSEAVNGTLAELSTILGFNYYNSTDFSISDYFTKSDILGFSYYNSTNFDINDYSTTSTILGWSYYNSTDFDIADYSTTATILGWSYYNSTDFSISDYFTKSDILGFSYYNSTDFDIADYFTKTNILGFSYYNSTDFDISNYLLTSNWNATNTSYYLATNPFSFYNSTDFDIANYLLTSNWNATNTSYRTLINNTFLGNVSFDTSTLFIDSTNGRVGVGTTSPASALEITGNLSFSTGADREILVEGGDGWDLTITAGSGGFPAGSLILQGGTGPGGLDIGGSVFISGSEGYTGGSVFIDGDDGTGGVIGDVLLQTSGSGNVGIRTGSPQNTLNVIGSINATGIVYGSNLFVPQYIFSHTNENISVLGVGTWTNITFSQEEADIKFGIQHTMTGVSNQTFNITEDGIYEFDYDLDVEDTSVSASDIGVAGRLIYTNGTEVVGSVFEIDITKQGASAELSHNFLVSCTAGDSFIVQFTASDSDVRISTHGTYGDHPESATILIKKISN